MPLQSSVQKTEQDLEKKLKDIKLKEEEEKYAESAKRFGFPFSTLKGVPINTDALNILDEDSSRKAEIAILYKTESRLIVALINPDSPQTKEVIESLKKRGFDLDILLTTPNLLSSVWQKYKIIKQRVFKIGAIEIDEKELENLQGQIKDIGDLKSKLQTISVTKLLEILLAGALKTKASDIHFEPETSDTRLRYRLDGILHDITNLDTGYYGQILNRVKVLSKMKLNIRDSPQD